MTNLLDFPGRSRRLHADVTASRAPGATRKAGFALPAVLAFLILLSLLATGGFLLARVEARISRYHRLSVQAFYLADGGLQSLLGSTQALPDTPANFRYPIDGQAVLVSGTRLLELPGGLRLHDLRSSVELIVPGGGSARRTVGVGALSAPAPVALAALLTPGTLVVDAGSSTISGIDGSSASCTPAGDVTGLATAGSAPVPAPSLRLLGAPPYRNLPADDPAFQELRSLWRRLRSPGGPTTPGPGSPTAWPVVRVPGGATLGAGGSGQGTLVATGELELSNGFRWRGWILVGGALRVTGSVRVDGAVASALDALLGETVAASQVTGPSASLTLAFHSCNVAAAGAALALPPTALPRTWREEMSWRP